jgi:hypothetical protein
VKDVQAVQEGDLIAAGPHKGGDIEDAERFQPEVIGGKVLYPGVHQEAFFLFYGHGKNIAS